MVCSHVLTVDDVIAAVRRLSADLIVKTILLDMQPFFEQLFIEKWMRTATAAKTILATANDYIRDLQEHLAPQFLNKAGGKCTTVHLPLRAHRD